MGHLLVDEEPGDHADDLASGGQGGVRDDTHQANPAAPVNDACPAGGQLGAENGGGLHMLLGARGRPGEDGYSQMRSSESSKPAGKAHYRTRRRRLRGRANIRGPPARSPSL